MNNACSFNSLPRVTSPKTAAGLLALWLLGGFGDNASAQGPLTNGWTHTGNIAPAGDSDSWTFTANVGDRIVVRAGELSATAFAPRLQLFSPTSVLLASSTTTVGAEIAVVATNSGTFTAVVTDNAGTQTNAYRITLAKSPGAVFVAPGDEGGPLTNGVMHTGTISVGDLDVWTVAATVGQSIVVRMGETNNVTFSPQLRIYDPSGALLSTVTTTVGAEVAVTATNTGTFLVVAGDFTGSWSGSGPYRLTLAKTGDPVVVSAGDEGGPLTNGVMHTGTISVGDLDVWTVAATVGQSIVVRMAETSSVTLNPQVRIYGPTGTLLGNVDTITGAEVAVTATNSGTFLVVAGDFLGSWSGSGPYRITLAKTGDPVVVSPGDEGGPLTNGVMHTGTIDVGDLDVWTVAAIVGQSIVVRMAEVTPGSSLNPQVRIYGPTGALLGNVDTIVGAEVAVTATNSGTFLVVAGDFLANWSGSGAYRITLAKTGDPVVVSAGDEGGPLTNGVMHTGTISVGDLDVWTVAAIVGQSIVVRMGEVTPSSSLNPQVRIYGPTGALLGNVDTVTGAEVAVTATNSGTFLVVAGDFLLNWSGSGPYRITLAKTGDPVVVSAGDEGGPLTNGVMHTGTIDVGDLDVWTVAAIVGQSIVVRMGEVTPASSLNPQVRIYGPTGALLGNVDTTIGAEVVVTAASSGMFLVVAGDFAGNWSGSGPYRLTLAKTGEPAAISAGDEGGPMTGSDAYTGTIGVGDLDVWTFTACLGENIFLRMDETVVGSTLTPQLRLYGRDGSLLNTASGVIAAQISRTAPAAGNYTVMAGDFSGSWSGSGGYTLTVSGLSGGLKLCLPTFSGTNVNLAGIGGGSNATFILFTHTNVTTPVTQWTRLLTNQFDQFGVFNRSNVSGRFEPERYFRLLHQ